MDRGGGILPSCVLSYNGLAYVYAGTIWFKSPFASPTLVTVYLTILYLISALQLGVIYKKNISRLHSLVFTVIKNTIEDEIFVWEALNVGQETMTSVNNILSLPLTNCVYVYGCALIYIYTICMSVIAVYVLL